MAQVLTCQCQNKDDFRKQTQSAVAVMKTRMDRPEMEQNTNTGPTVRWTPAADVYKPPTDVSELFSCFRPSGVWTQPGEQLRRGEVDIPLATVVSLAPGKDLGFDSVNTLISRK